MIETQNATTRVMPTLLHLDSSMRHEGSRSRALSAHFAAAWQQANLSGTVVYRDLAADPIPHLDLTAFSANFVADDDRTPPQREARKLTETLANELLRADELVIGIPLYNFGPPSTLKAWFDRIVVQGLTVKPGGGGLLGGRPLTFTAARGGGYGPGTPRERWHAVAVSVRAEGLRVRGTRSFCEARKSTPSLASRGSSATGGKRWQTCSLPCAPKRLPWVATGCGSAYSS